MTKKIVAIQGNHPSTHKPVNDTSVFLTNEMNVRHSTDNRLQYLFFLNTIRKRNRFSKWHKPYESKKLDTVKTYFGVSTQKAKEYLELLNDKQYRELKNSMKIGGKNNG